MKKEIEEALNKIEQAFKEILPEKSILETKEFLVIRQALETDKTLEIVKINKERMVRENIMNNIPIPDALSFANEIISESEGEKK